jgi:hypothetical protein
MVCSVVSEEMGERTMSEWIKRTCECGNDTYHIYDDIVFTVKTCSLCGKRSNRKEKEQ